MALATASPASRMIGAGEVLFRTGRNASKPIMLRTRPGRVNGTQAQARTPAAVSTSFTGPGGNAVTSGTVTLSGSTRAELLGQCERLIRPARREGFSVLGPYVRPDRFLIQHHICAICADRPTELAEHLLQPRLGFGRRAIDQARRILGYDMFKCRPPSQCNGAGTKPQAEKHEHDEQQQRNQVQQQPKALFSRFNPGPVTGKTARGPLRGPFGWARAMKAFSVSSTAGSSSYSKRACASIARATSASGPPRAPALQTARSAPAAP